MINKFGISFSEFQQQAQNLPTLNNIETQCVTINHKYLPLDQKFILQLKTITQFQNKYIQVQAQLLYNTIINIPQFYFTLQDCNSSEYIPIHNYIEDQIELQNFIKDINPINNIVMYTMHNCLLPEFIQFVTDKNQFLLTLISYYFSKLNIFIKIDEQQ